MDHFIDLGETLVVIRIHGRPMHHGQEVRGLLGAPMLEKGDRRIKTLRHRLTVFRYCTLAGRLHHRGHGPNTISLLRAVLIRGVQERLLRGLAQP
jgi:hypothetical protein